MDLLSWIPSQLAPILPVPMITERSSLASSSQGKHSPTLVEDGGGAGEEVEGRRPILKRLKADARGPDVKIFFNKAFPQAGIGKFSENNEAEVYEADVISCLQFNRDGELLAVGDKGGRINVYKRVHDKLFRNVNYNHYHGFQSHEAEFDYLKSIEIEEKICKIEWIPKVAFANFFLSTNDKTIKLWKLEDKVSSNTEHVNLKDKHITSLTLPRIVKNQEEKVVTSTLRRTFTNAHNYHINSVSVNSDQETFLSSDDLRINLWNLEITDQSFVIVDIKPENMEFLTEVITSTSFHPSRCNLFAYSTCKGVTRLCDMRESALCDKHSKLFHDPVMDTEPSYRTYFSEVVASTSAVTFSNSGRYMATRDYLNCKIWDTHMENKPVVTIPIHDYLQPHLNNLYENDAIFDRFGVSWNGSDTRLVTGSYNNFFVVADTVSSKSVFFETPTEFGKQSKTAPLKPKRIVNIQQNLNLPVTGGDNKSLLNKDSEEVATSDVDITKKILTAEWHPKENIMAVATCNNLYFFQDKRLFS